MDRSIRPRRLAILLLILIGFLGGILLAVWAFLRRPTEPRETAPPLIVSPLPETTPSALSVPSLEPFSERDTDGDGLRDPEEVQLGTDLTRADTDGDGYTDKQEIDKGYDPLGPGKLDSDRDGLADPDERCWATDLRNPDSDGDGYLDGQEVANRHDPRIPSPNDQLTAPPPCG